MEPMRIEDTHLSGVKLITPTVFRDTRGYFLELHHQPKYDAGGLDVVFVQDNFARSQRHVLRGLHYQYPAWQGKLVSVLDGAIFDVAVDLRRDSPGFGQWFGIELSARDHRQLYIAPGFAHGYCVLSETALVHYKCTSIYRPEQERTLLWNDPTLKIAWPVTQPLLSDKDARGLTWDQVVAEL